MNILKNLKRETIISSIVYILAGIILIIFPQTTARTIGYAFACILILLGIRCIIKYMKRDIKMAFYHYDLVTAAVLILASVCVFINVDAVVAFIPFILGIFVTISGVIKLQNALDLWRLQNGGSVMVFILAVINVVFGIVLIVNPFGAMATLIRIIGIGLIYSGVTDLITVLCISGKIKRYEEANGIIEGEVIIKDK